MSAVSEQHLHIAAAENIAVMLPVLVGVPSGLNAPRPAVGASPRVQRVGRGHGIADEMADVVEKNLVTNR